ncbi:MAG: DUF3769 domain-containing protein [Nostocaceae cyanobacterium]|nr:DUF3769 domain-containing protein [Nostocaceae cyanobacterium]
MLHPVLPPPTPAILATVPTANPTPVARESPLDVNKNQSQGQSETLLQEVTANVSPLSGNASAQKSVKHKLPVTQKLFTPSKPETFSPVFSPIGKSISSAQFPITTKSPDLPRKDELKVENKAADLAGGLSVGLPVQEMSEEGEPSFLVHHSNSQGLNQKLQRYKETRETQAEDKSQSSFTQQSLSGKALVSGQTPNIEKPQQGETEKLEKAIRIPFTTYSQANQTPTPSTIEFKSRTPINQVPNPAETAPTPQEDTITESESQPPTTTPPSNNPPERRRVIEVVADRQEYDDQRRIVTAEGNVVVRFDGGVVDADRLQVNLDNLIAVGEGNVALTRGDQVLRGQRFTYNFIQDSGELMAGSGEIFIPTAGQDFNFLPTDVTAGGVPAQPLSDRIRANQPLEASSPGGINIVLGGARNVSNLPVGKQGGEVRRLRFEAARVDFYPRGWQARDVSITNDPFSPPELELRADKVTLTQESPQRDRIKTKRQRLVFDRGLSLPIPKDQQVIDRRERNTSPALVSFGFDGDERGGLFVERSFNPINQEKVIFTLTPQFFAQKAVDEGASDIPALFGLKANLDATLGPQTKVEGKGNLTSLDLGDVENSLRASLRLRQAVGDLRNPHNLTFEYSYRDRLFNGTLGFQTVQSSLGGIITSPIIPVAKGINLSYQAGAQLIEANTDRQDLLDADRSNNRVSLGRFQASAALNGGLLLWSGKALPATAKEGLRYTPNPVVPYITAFAGVTGTTSYYTNGEDQSTLIGTIGLQGQFGNFSKRFFDYTGFNISFSEGFNTGESPFLFDRAADTTTLSAGITQQIYGPLRFGLQTSINLDTREAISTDYVLEYSRRTYGISLRYNPELELGGITFRISDFNWTGGTNPFSDSSEVKPVVGGVTQGK